MSRDGRAEDGIRAFTKVLRGSLAVCCQLVDCEKALPPSVAPKNARHLFPWTGCGRLEEAPVDSPALARGSYPRQRQPRRPSTKSQRLWNVAGSLPDNRAGGGLPRLNARHLFPLRPTERVQPQASSLLPASLRSIQIGGIGNHYHSL